MYFNTFDVRTCRIVSFIEEVFTDFLLQTSNSVQESVSENIIFTGLQVFFNIVCDY